ncbi:membrane protein insertion efficiency factor YidD [Candidatus Ichthyocystis hellenicum]|uniref:membrane protein insertion efficiency factor YidD n=1 Tax=Candidatus Ichthyocystis hellenicum TaxID=1561003 RepID=UPI000A6828F5|nr:membrane protein insertion efficiency factor YidD [Candidatus Ichthyocystis hellenicum]
MVRSFLSSLLIFFIRLYRLFLSPFLGRNCRFFPSCSVYAELAIKKYGPCKGLLMAIYRILRCNPMNRRFGEDNP